MKRLGQLTAAIGAALAGLGAAVFLHPRSGRRNRQAAAGAARRQSANVAAIVGTSVGRAPGKTGRAQTQVVEEVRAALLASFGAAADEVEVTAHRRTVTLRGEVSRLEHIDAMEAATRHVTGVADVNNLLRLRVRRPPATEASSSVSSAP